MIATVISVRELTKLYGDFTAVRSISFDVGAGEVLGLVGPNGAGKTTTLRCLAGIIAPSSGHRDDRRARHSARLDRGQARARVHSRRAASVRVSHRRGASALHRAPLRRRRRRSANSGAARRARARPRSGRSLPGELSRGMRQKLAIACGLLHSPSVLILDEPLTGLDPGGMRRMRETIAARATAGAAVILSSHLLNLVEELCTKLLVLRRGECVAYRHDRRDHRHASRSRRTVARGHVPRAHRRSRRVAMNAFFYLAWTSGRNRFVSQLRARAARGMPPR